jgi:hypothetical protein
MSLQLLNQYLKSDAMLKHKYKTHCTTILIMHKEDDYLLISIVATVIYAVFGVVSNFKWATEPQKLTWKKCVLDYYDLANKCWVTTVTF